MDDYDKHVTPLDYPEHLDTAVHDKDLLYSLGVRTLANYTRAQARFRLRTYYKFVTVRNPYNRLYSAYVDKLVNSDIYRKVSYATPPPPPSRPRHSPVFRLVKTMFTHHVLRTMVRLVFCSKVSWLDGIY